MNQRLQGWKLVLALLLPATIIGAAGFLAYDTLTDNSQDIAISGEAAESEPEPTPTTPPETDAVEPAVVPTAAPPTAVPLPTPLATAVPAAEPDPTVEPTTAPAPTSAPAPTAAPASQPAPSQPAQPAEPTATATPEPDLVTISCLGSVPSTLRIGGTFGPLTADITPSEAGLTHLFSFDTGVGTVQGRDSGEITYITPGTYPVTLRARNLENNETTTTSCGTVTVADGAASASLAVRCVVTPVDSTIELKDAEAPDTMRVTTRWTPAATKLSLTYSFAALDQLIIVDDASTGNSQVKGFASENDATFSIPAYPGKNAATVTPKPTATDSDGDGISNSLDNCPNTVNPDQLNADGDTQGDVCDDDDDGDNTPDINDNCPLVSNIGQTDTDLDGIGDDCDNCPNESNSDQADANGDGVGDACPGGTSTGGTTGGGGTSADDADGDGVANSTDNCPSLANADQADADGDGAGDVCDTDRDGDGIDNSIDNCVDTPNNDQADDDGDNIGNVCEV